ncbi:MAG TPA: carboxypeptidase-like regulatory domain-containing protein, partial [Pyrinomonadaceae bacterium]|nr:carboxypeptidase-like regulatory domain-containing protein [Pyrinomonadaceae bacterium]
MVSLLRTALLLNSHVSFVRRRVATLLAGFVLVGYAATLSLGQSVTGTISGVVLDPNGAVVPGAAVTLVKNETNDKRSQQSNESGRFNFASLQPGVYSVKIEHAGFESLLRTNVVLSANEDLALGDINLKTGQVTETVTVSSEGQIVEKESSDLTARLTSDQLSLISTK